MKKNPPANLITKQRIVSASPGEFLRSIFRLQGITLTEAAKKIGTSQPTLSLILSDKRAISHSMARKMEAAFGVNSYVLARLRFEQDFDANAQGEIKRRAANK